VVRKNIKLPEPLFDALREDKPDGVTWPDYLEARCLTERETPETPDTVSYDDVVNATRQAIREELPVDQMGGR